MLSGPPIFTSSYLAMSHLSMPGDRHNRRTDLTAIATGAGACDVGRVTTVRGMWFVCMVRAPVISVGTVDSPLMGDFI